MNDERMLDEELLEKYKDNAKSYLEEVIGKNEYVEVTQGGEFKIYSCPNCGSKQFVQYDCDNTDFVCLHCGIIEEISNFNLCSECGEPFKNDDVTECFCDECSMSIFKNKD